MALNDIQTKGVIELFAKAFTSAGTDEERKKILIDFEDTFGKNMNGWEKMCKEKVEEISDNEQILEVFNKLVNRKEDIIREKQYEIHRFQQKDIPEVCECSIVK